jgi:broad specificity phosphatase PhoE
MTSWRERLAAKQAMAKLEKTETTSAAAELPKMFMVRHLERIDVTNNQSTEEYKKWLKQSNDYNYLINPYLDTEISVSRLGENLEDIKIDHIICSPYVRCMQTAILIINNLGLNIINKTIHIDYKLGELVDEAFFFRVPLNIESVYLHSKKYIEEKFNMLSFTLDDKDNEPLIFTNYESMEEYNKRILDELKVIREKYSGNILVITHADAFKQFNTERKRMEYGRVYKIDLDRLEGGYKQKYMKYKTKYIELKKKLRN